MQPAYVKNRAPAAIQITAEQLLREARERQIEEEVSAAQRDALLKQQQINDPEELAMFQATKRKQFEEKLRNTLHNVSNYLSYAAWEASQLEFRRARSIFERAIDIDYRDYQVWLKYAEFEMKNKFINHARNVWNRAVTLLPRVSQLWYKYVHMEEMLGQIDNARIVFERWMKWEPEEQAWYSYINFEERVGEIGRARDIYERYCATYPLSSSYVKYAKWEERHSQLVLARNIYERSVSELPEHNRDEQLFIAFAKFEERCHEYERARMIFKQSLDLLPKHETRRLYREFVTFEKKHGSTGGIDFVVLSKRRLEYEKELELDPRNYDTWFDFVRLEEAEAIAEATSILENIQEQEDEQDKTVLIETIKKGRERVRDIYERAVAQIPLVEEKKYWKRYVYLWIYYALFEELVVEDIQRSRQVYNTALKVIPHKQFTFAKLWIMAAELEIRNKNINAARKLFGKAIGMSPKPSLFNAYIRFEKQMGNTDRCRILYQKYLEHSPQECDVWLKFANLERQVRDYERVRAIYELAISQKHLDMPELLWKKYIDFEIFIGTSSKTNQGFERAQVLYERLLERTKHVKVWISFGKFLCLTFPGKADDGRSVFNKAYEYFKSQPDQNKEERVALLEAWVEVEQDMISKKIEGASEEEAEKVKKMMPKKLKKRRELPDSEGWEEYYDYVFPDDEKSTKGLKLLEIAQKWKRSGGIMNALKAAKRAKADAQQAEQAQADTNELDIDDL